MKSEDMKDEWEEADAKQQQQVEEHEHDERSSCTGCKEKMDPKLDQYTPFKPFSYQHFTPISHKRN